MKKLIVTIAKGNETYGAWIENLPGVYGQGDTVEEAKNSLTAGLDLYIRNNSELPEIIKDGYEMEYHLVTRSIG